MNRMKLSGSLSFGWESLQKCLSGAVQQSALLLHRSLKNLAPEAFWAPRDQAQLYRIEEARIYKFSAPKTT